MYLPDSNSQYEELGPGQNPCDTINAGQQNDGYEQPVNKHGFVQPVNNPNNVPYEYGDVQGATGRVRDEVRHKNIRYHLVLVIVEQLPLLCTLI